MAKLDLRIHLGAHRTATKDLGKIAALNQKLLESQGILFLSGGPTQENINTANKALEAGEPLETVQEELIRSLTQGRDFSRLVLSHPGFLGAVSRPFARDLFYVRASQLTKSHVRLFSHTDLRCYIGIRNPASFIPSCYSEFVSRVDQKTYKEFLGEVNYRALRWSDLLERLQTAAKDIPLTVWRLEDYPYNWREVFQAISGVENKEKLVGPAKPIKQGIALRGSKLLARFLVEHPPENIQMRRKVVTAFAAKFPPDSDSDDNEDWTKSDVDFLTDCYEDDWYYIERMEGVTALQPRRFD